VEGDPLHPPAHARRSDPSRQPHLEPGPRARGGGGAEESHLPVRAPEKRAQHFPARVLAAPTTYRQRQRALFRQQRHGPLREDEHGDFATAPRSVRQRLALQVAQQPLGAVHLSHQERAQPVRLLERPGDVLEAGPSRGELPDLQLLEGERSLVAADGCHVVDEVVARAPPPRRSGPADAALGLELDAGEQARGLDQGAQAPRRLGRSRQRPFALELGHFGFERLRDGERHAAVRPAVRAQGQNAPVVHPDAEATAHSAAPQRPVGRVEIRVALEGELQRPGAQPEGELRRDHAVQHVQARDVGLPLGERGHRC
jgi:hypothetical protein